MGSGKTTLGKWIAENQGYIFVDTDELIETEEGRTINEIFATDGEEYFRNLETQVIGRLAEDDRKLVISVGGGLPVRDENRKLMRRAGRVVYLNTGVDELERRLKGDTTRPLLAGSDLRKKITDLMEKRERLYLDAADVVVDTENRTFEEIYHLI
jgi:shikimate kinase